MRHVIIGSGIAGLSAARSIRESDAGAEITMVASDPLDAYYRPKLLSLIEQEDMDISLGADLVGHLGVQTAHDTARGVNGNAKTVELTSGRHLSYDKLLIATGSNPVIPDIPGIQGDGVFPLRTIEDARGIQSTTRGSRNVVVLGGGFVGIRTAVALKHLGLNVTIIEKLDRLLYEKVDQRASAIVSDLLKREGIDIATNQDDYEIIRSHRTIESVRLASGRIIDADFVVVAVGTKPNISPFVDSGMRTNKGILIGEHLETSIPDVYAAGDVVEYRDLVSNAFAVSASWTNAEEMGRLAGRNMAGASVRYAGFLSLMSTVEILDLPIMTVGLVSAIGKGFEVIASSSENVYRKLVFKDDLMKGALLIGQREDTDVYAYFIKNQIPLGSLKRSAIQGGLRYSDILKPQFRTAL